MLGSQQTELFGNAARKGQLNLNLPPDQAGENRESLLDEQLHQLLSYEETSRLPTTEILKS